MILETQAMTNTMIRNPNVIRIRRFITYPPIIINLHIIIASIS